MKHRKTILIDLDGVLNNYNGTYEKDSISSVKTGAQNFLEELNKDYEITIFTTRDINLAEKWVKDNNIDYLISHITNYKEPAYLIIDDRCLTFNGDFDKILNQIKQFKPYWKQ